MDHAHKVIGNKETKEKLSWEHENKSCVSGILVYRDYKNRQNTFREQGNTKDIFLELNMDMDHLEGARHCLKGGQRKHSRFAKCVKSRNYII